MKTILQRGLIMAFASFFAIAPLSVAPVSAADDDNEALTTIRGTLTSLSDTALPATLTVQSEATTYTVTVTADTKLVRKYNGRSALSEFGIGDDLRVRGTLAGTSMTATHIKNYSIQWRGRHALWGTIDSIDAAAKSFVYTPKRGDPLTVTTNDGTKVFQGNRAGEFADLEVGMTVRVIGVWNKSADTIAANRILIKLTTLNGKVTAVDADAKTFDLLVRKRGVETTHVITTNDETVFHTRYFGLTSFDTLEVGDAVHVRGLKTGDTALTALVVWDKSERKRFRVEHGTIESIDADAMTFVMEQKQGDDLTVLVVTGTVLVNKDGTVMAFADLAVGDTVQVWGVLADDELTALVVRNKTLLDTWRVTEHGTIGSLDADARTFVLDQEEGEDLTVIVTSETSIVNKKGVTIEFGNLSVGDEVQVKGTRVRTELTAMLVKDKDLGSDD
ncbi:MAG: hypothetical protein HYZ09_04145 [Candidatus Kerfeldbacteria bacterium]|nr:hypothetical protein [Candidatus Kerfeldbacteria bacterium]